MKDLVSQDYIDYQDGRDHFRYFGQPVDPLGKDSQNYHWNIEFLDSRMIQKMWTKTFGPKWKSRPSLDF